MLLLIRNSIRLMKHCCFNNIAKQNYKFKFNETLFLSFYIFFISLFEQEKYEIMTKFALRAHK